ncbi:MAG TPA: c-type cytochrome [Terriglobales bacterium]|nr:c-type cytochrome [Terriglobales bacterium]
MRRLTIFAALLFLAAGCSRSRPAAPALQPTGWGTAITEASGGKQAAGVGMLLDQPVVVQVNDAQGSGVTGAAVTMQGPAGVRFDPASGLTDSSGQFTTSVSLGGVAGRYQITAWTADKSGKRVELKLEEIALGYQEGLGQQFNRQYCSRCHDPESTPERVSNYDNLTTKPHAFTEGDTLNKMSEADLTAIISHGGPALGKSPEMPSFGYTLSKSEIQALVAYVRAVSDPPYQTAGVVYAQK